MVRAVMMALVCGWVLVGAQPALISLELDRSIASDRTGAVITVSRAVNLDTYSFSLLFDTTVAQIVSAGISFPSRGIVNALEATDGQVIPIVKRGSGVVTISATLVGDEPPGMIEGALGVVVFAVKKNETPQLQLEAVTLLDHKRTVIDHSIGNAKGK